MSASAARPIRFEPRTRSRRLRVTLKRSAKKLSGRVRASSVIRHSAPSAVRRAPILSWACAYPKLFRVQRLASDGGAPAPRRPAARTTTVSIVPAGASLAADLKPLDYLVDASEADQQRRPPRQDVGALDRVGLARPHRPDPVPASPARARAGPPRGRWPRRRGGWRAARRRRSAGSCRAP